ncbi:hypothetical protein GCM10020367_33520 [Streptomyces sannanensis]|uniref:Uncharacterized protein n=1 Tax=Streptomyces sannanensis TaxID=285536 RepID=A0ABP6SCY1_9ACTN
MRAVAVARSKAEPGIVELPVLPAGVEGVDVRTESSPELLDVPATCAAEGSLKVAVTAEVPLERTPEALARGHGGPPCAAESLGEGGARGKTVIVIRTGGTEEPVWRTRTSSTASAP